MPKIRRPTLALVVAALAALSLTACGDDDSAASSTSSTACQKADPATVSPWTLTVATDAPAFPPHVLDDDPTNGNGFESALASAIADQLGFTREEVRWIRVPFNATFAPGPKKYDFDLSQVSINARRKKAADFSSPYYTTPRECSWRRFVARGGHHGGRAEGRADRGPGRHHQPRYGERGDRALQAGARIQQLERRGPRAEERAGGRDRH